MRQRLLIILTLIVVVVVLVLLNAATYVKVEPTADSESSPDRSTFNGGATGTRALYDFLKESGYDVARWRESTTGLLSFSGPKPATFVVIGNIKVPYTRTEADEVLHWVETGGRLVIIDRSPARVLLPDAGDWRIAADVTNYPFSDVDPTDFEQMTRGVKAATPSQPTLLARNVEQVMPSRFAAAITLTPHVHDQPNGKVPEQQDESTVEPGDDDLQVEPTPSPSPEETTKPEDERSRPSAPVTHFGDARGALLISYRHGHGEIVLLSDPYFVANNGINRADNLQLAINIIVGAGGPVAFDEFHQGHGSTQNALLE